MFSSQLLQKLIYGPGCEAGRAGCHPSSSWVNDQQADVGRCCWFVGSVTGTARESKPQRDGLRTDSWGAVGLTHFGASAAHVPTQKKEKKERSAARNIFLMNSQKRCGERNRYDGGFFSSFLPVSVAGNESEDRKWATQTTGDLSGFFCSSCFQRGVL